MLFSCALRLAIGREESKTRGRRPAVPHVPFCLLGSPSYFLAKNPWGSVSPVGRKRPAIRPASLIALGDVWVLSESSKVVNFPLRFPTAP
jgi:hypothetical protein